MSDVPLIRVSLHEESKQRYSADNRRCFALKVVAPLVPLNPVEVESINWEPEIDDKLGGTGGAGSHERERLTHAGHCNF